MGHLFPNLMRSFLGPLDLISTPNGISIGSAVFAQLAAEQ